MVRHVLAALALALIALAGPAFAYPATVAIRDFSAKLPTDDLVVIDVTNVGRDNRIWFNTPFGPGIQSIFQIQMIDGTVELVRTPPYYDGMVTSLAHIQSLDRLHDLTTTSGAARYDMRAYVTTDFMWIEAWPSGMRNSTVRSTVFFVGPNSEVYQYLLNNRNNGIRYANLSELKADIQNNYATPFNSLMPGPFLYTKQGWSAIISSVQKDPTVQLNAQSQQKTAASKSHRN